MSERTRFTAYRETWLRWRAGRLRVAAKKIVREALARGRALRERADKLDVRAAEEGERR